MKYSEKRTNSFLWETRQELYDYFLATYKLGKSEVDAEVDQCMKEFKVRQGETINTRELWQKVGMSLERKVGGKKTSGRKISSSV